MTTAQLKADLTPNFSRPERPPVHPTVRYAELTPPDRRLLLILGAGGQPRSADELAQALDATPEALQGRLRGLVALDMVEARTDGWTLTEAIRVRVRQDLNVAVGARLVVACQNRVRPSGLTVGERVLARLCWSLFTPHLVLTRVPLRQVLDVQAISALLDEQDRAFLSHSGTHLDVLVEDGGTGQPLLALELDGPQHWESPQRDRDVRKDRILRVAGLPLLRVWTDELEPPEEPMLRALLGWRLRAALGDEGFRAACPGALLGGEA